MDYTLTSPCANCPFRKTKAGMITPGRAFEISDMMLDRQGGQFPCHKTVDYSAVEDVEEDAQVTEKTQHCAGALIFAEKIGKHGTQMMRIMERLGMYDAKKLMADPEVVALVYDSREEMIEAAEAAERQTDPPCRKKTKKRKPAHVRRGKT